MENRRRKRNRERIRKELKARKLIFQITIVTFVVGTLLLFCGGSVVRNEKRQKEQIEANARIEAEKAREEELARQKAEIDLVLEKDEFGTQLTKLYAAYPQMDELLLNREEYPDWLIEYLIGHEEAVDWVIDYPEYMVKTEEEINEEALKPVNLEEYQSQEGIPMFFQWDQTWGYASYGDGNIAINGCGPTCLSMVATGLLGDTSMTPKWVADFSSSSGYCTENGETSWTLMSEGAAQLGLYARQVDRWYASALIEELSAGYPIICSMGPGDFTDLGHFIVLVGVTEDGKVIVNDPNSRVNSEKEWDAQVLLDQMKAMWKFSR